MAPQAHKKKKKKKKKQTHVAMHVDPDAAFRSKKKHVGMVCPQAQTIDPDGGDDVTLCSASSAIGSTKTLLSQIMAPQAHK
jgi:hypothetical protein